MPGRKHLRPKSGLRWSKPKSSIWKHLTVKAFKASSEVTKIKMEFDGEAFKGGFEMCKQKIVSRHSNWNLSFLHDPDLLDALELGVIEETLMGVVFDEVLA